MEKFDQPSPFETVLGPHLDPRGTSEVEPSSHLRQMAPHTNPRPRQEQKPHIKEESTAGPTTLFVCVHDKPQRISSHPTRFDIFGEMISDPFQLSLDQNGQLPVISGTSSIGCWLKGEPLGLFEVNMQDNVDVVPARPAKTIAGSRADHKTVRSVL